MKEASGGELPPGKIDVDRVIREVRRVATGVQVVIEKVGPHGIHHGAIRRAMGLKTMGALS